ncbi:S8 family peptidase [Nocardioides sp.]|uniref:S8 family peptidase n=1 Tax=Nocardioides sp. TaxID=35761 RepID=UPI002BA4FF44|nr:S8 family serine peptidase [Nocardioides sp.]HXH78948.1 S8 family serine peptidase [Nocardioides sp.]
MQLVHKIATSLAAVGALVLAGAQPALSNSSPSSSTAAATGENTTYIVLYNQKSLPADLSARVGRADGTLVAGYDAIGVAIARSTSTSFATQMRSDGRVSGVAASRAIASVAPSGAQMSDSHDQPSELPNSPATPDSLAALQWDMRQISAPQAHAITGGSPSVVVGDIDTGLDKDHPDLQQNIDFARSASCESGVPNQDPAAWDDHHGHGTHTAGTIAAADNGFGITGVAPNVKVAGIKASNDDGYFFSHMVVCAFMWAGSQQMDVTNNSYYMDPYLYNCRNNADQRVLWKATQRAALYAQNQGVLHVAAQGNDSDDRAHPTFDDSSPNFPPDAATERDITNACVVVPLELPGVVGVTSVGNTRQVDGDDDPNDYLKAYYSAYGVGVAEVTAPGGDFFYGRGTEGQPFGLILSTWPSDAPCGRSVKEDTAAGSTTYCYAQGTSMAAPHASGVAALIISRYGDLDNPQNGKMRPGSVAAYLQQTADSQPCPTELPLTGAPGSSRATRPYATALRPDGQVQECQGGAGYNSWYGNGQINALKAVTHRSGQ